MTRTYREAYTILLRMKCFPLELLIVQPSISCAYVRERTSTIGVARKTSIQSMEQSYPIHIMCSCRLMDKAPLSHGAYCGLESASNVFLDWYLEGTWASLNGSLILLDFVATILPPCAMRVLNVPSCLCSSLMHQITLGTNKSRWAHSIRRPPYFSRHAPTFYASPLHANHRE